jgi:hypothetical protein
MCVSFIIQVAATLIIVGFLINVWNLILCYKLFKISDTVSAIVSLIDKQDALISHISESN